MRLQITIGVALSWRCHPLLLPPLSPFPRLNTRPNTILGMLYFAILSRFCALLRKHTFRPFFAQRKFAMCFLSRSRKWPLSCVHSPFPLLWWLLLPIPHHA